MSRRPLWGSIASYRNRLAPTTSDITSCSVFDFRASRCDDFGCESRRYVTGRVATQSVQHCYQARGLGGEQISGGLVAVNHRVVDHHPILIDLPS